MAFGMCPNCMNQLTEDSALVTKSSSIFKGNNVYLMCKNCQQVLLYNKDRDMIFDLNEYKDDDDVLEEINKLLSEVDNHYEVASSANCTGNCSQCGGCDTQFKRASKERRAVSKPEEPVKEEVEVTNDMVKQVLEQHFLAIRKIDPSQKKLLTEQEFSLIDVNDWVFFELTPVEIEPVITYKVVRH